MTKDSRGVFFSANDHVEKWTTAFLNSFREFNPGTRLVFIPFDNHCHRILKKQDTYEFETYEDPLFARLEAIGHSLDIGLSRGIGKYWFRRFAAFWGPLDQFLYLDARQVVLGDVEPLLTAPLRYDYDLMHYDCVLNQVYEPGEFRRSLLKKKLARGFNSGRWASRRGLFDISELEVFGKACLKLRDQMNPRNTDQFFLNFCCDNKPILYGHFAEVLGGLVHNAWAAQPGRVYRDRDKYRLWHYGGNDHKKRFVILHWAGIRETPTMPERGLFCHFLYLRKPVLLRILRGCVDMVLIVVRNPIELLRKNRLVNTVYHALRTGGHK